MRKPLSEMSLEELWQFFLIFLVEHPDLAQEYESLKCSLWKKYEHNRDGYTNAKTEFITMHTKEARKHNNSKNSASNVCKKVNVIYYQTFLKNIKKQ